VTIPASAELAHRLREAGPEELTALLEEHRDGLGVEEVRSLLRNPHAALDQVSVVLENRRLLSLLEVRRELVTHRATPRPRALELVPTLFWRDLVRISGDARVAAPVRRAADRELAGRLTGLAVGERMTIARIAGAGVLSALRNDPNPRVIGALLANSRLTEGLLLPLVSNERTAPPVLEAVARSERWGVRYAVRAELAKNPGTPPATALGLLPHLKKPDLQAVTRSPRVAAVVQQRARLLLGHGP
jgi:hypothetical protein